MEADCRGLDLSAFLIKPVQRLCKYPLLMREIVRHTNTEHSDYHALLGSQETIEKAVEAGTCAARGPSRHFVCMPAAQLKIGLANVGRDLFSRYSEFASRGIVSS